MNPYILYQLDGGWTLDMLHAMNGDLFDGLNMDPNYPDSWDMNPVNKIVKDDDLWALLNERVSGINGTSLVRAQVICQQAMWDGKGPEGDRLPKTLRKLWYAGHKEALQHISRRLGVWRARDQMNDTQANATMIKVYGEFVDTGLVTYLDMYAKDGSRSFEVFEKWARLPSPLSNLLMAIEKDAAYEDCVRIGKALGAAAAVSGGGKMGKAGTENVVRSALSTNWHTDRPGDLVTETNPLYLLVISDWDYDGEAVIAPTFANQLERYIDPSLIHWVRVGVTPDQVEIMGYGPEEKSYQVKYDVNSAYTAWCREKADFLVHTAIYRGLKAFKGVVQHAKYQSPMLGYEMREMEDTTDHKLLKSIFEACPPLGYELDALKRVEYAELIINGLLTLISWGDLLDALSRKAWSSDYDVTESVLRGVLADNEDYQALTQHIAEAQEWFDDLMADLERTKERFEDDARSEIRPLVEKWNKDDRIKEGDPVPEQSQMAEHLRQVNPWEHWQPYSKSTRNTWHEHVIEVEEEETLDELAERSVPFTKVQLG